MIDLASLIFGRRNFRNRIFQQQQFAPEKTKATPMSGSRFESYGQLWSAGALACVLDFLGVASTDWFCWRSACPELA
jgi:hypothetical protein